MARTPSHRNLVDILNPLELGEWNGVDDGFLTNSSECDRDPIQMDKIQFFFLQIDDSRHGARPAGEVNFDVTVLIKFVPNK